MTHLHHAFNTVSRTIAVAALCVASSYANASLITVETGMSTALAQKTGAGYQAVVEAAIAVKTAGYGAKTVAKFDGLNNRSLFGAAQNIATKYTVDFLVSEANAGSFSFRFGTDFTYGGAVFIDNALVAYNNSDMWWNNTYTVASEIFQFTSLLNAGTHTIEIFGLEPCCDGIAQGQFKSAKSTVFTTFSTTDGMNPAIPEPSSIALLGLGVAGLLASRKKFG